MNKFVFISLLAFLIAHSRAVSLKDTKTSSPSYIDHYFEKILKPFKEDIVSNVISTDIVYDHEERIRMTNEYVDNVLADLRVVADEYLNPLHLHDVDQLLSFNLNNSGIWHGYMLLKDGKANNLNSIRRDRDVTIQRLIGGPATNVIIPFNFKKLKFSYGFSMIDIGADRSGDVKGEIQDLKYNWKFSVDVSSKLLLQSQVELVSRGPATYHFPGDFHVDLVTGIVNEVLTQLVDVVIKLMF